MLWTARRRAPQRMMTRQDSQDSSATERALERSEREYRDLVNTIDGIVWQADARTFRFSFVSRQAEKILGYPVSRWLDEPTFWRDHLHEDDRQEAVRYCQEATERMVPHELEYRMRTADGRDIWLRDIVSVIVEEDRPVLLRGVMIDVTALKRAEQERDRVLALEQAARSAAEEALRARDEFLSIASHELRTPCTSLTLAVQSLLRHTRAGSLVKVAPGVADRILATADRQARQLSCLIDRLLDVSRIRGGRLDLELEEVDLSALASGVAGGFRDQFAAAGSALSLQAPAPVVGRWDRSRIEQVLTNLLSNALRYGAGEPVELCVEARAPIARIVVRDHGIGIAPEQQGRIFDRFARATSTTHYGGFGLGLYITRAIVQAHGGTIGVESAPGGGSTFRVEMPSAGPPHGRAAGAGSGEGAPP